METLTEAEKIMAKQLGLTVEEFLAEKQKREAQPRNDGTMNGTESKKKAEKKKGRAPKKAKAMMKEKTPIDKKIAKALKKTKGVLIPALIAAKERYAAQGDPTSCGDWLAQTLKEHFVSKNAETGRDETDIDGFTKCLRANGVDLDGPWAANRSPGWQGRYRMNGRQKLEISVARQGHLVVGKEKIKPTQTFLKLVQTKHSVTLKEKKEK